MRSHCHALRVAGVRYTIASKINKVRHMCPYLTQLADNNIALGPSLQPSDDVLPFLDNSGVSGLQLESFVDVF